MSKVLLQAKANITATTDNGSGSWTLGLNLTENNGVYNSLSVVAGDILVISTSTFENGTYTRFIIDSTAPTSATSLNVTCHYDATQDNASAPDLNYAFGYDCLLTRPTANHGLLPTPATGIQAITDDYAEYVSNMNLVKLDAIVGTGTGGPIDLSDYSTTVEMNNAISTAVGGIDTFSGNYADLTNTPTLATVATTGSYNDLTDKPTFADTGFDGSYNSLIDAPTTVSSFTNDSGYATENYVDTSIASIPATDLSDYSTTLETTSAINTAISQYDAAAIKVSSLDDLSDVQVTGTGHTPTEGQALVWNAGHGHWMPGDIDPNLTAYSTTTEMNAAISAQIDAIPEGANVAVSDTAPATPADNDLWWDSAAGKLKIYYNDGTSSQWVDASPSAAVPTNVSAFTNDAGYLTSETPDTVTTLVDNGDNTLTYTAEDGTETVIDLSLYLDNVNLARITSGTLDSATGIATFTRDDQSTFDLNLSSLLTGITSYNDLADVPNTLVHTNTYNTFTNGNSFTGGMNVKNSDLIIQGVSKNTFDVDGETPVPATQRTISFYSRAKDAETGIIDPNENAYTNSAWFGQPNYDDNVMLFLNSDAGNFASITANMTTGTTRIGSAGPGYAGLTVGNGLIKADSGSVFTGDGSGLTNLDANLARLDGDQTFTGTATFDVPTMLNSGSAQAALNIMGVRDGTVDDQGADVTPTYMHLSFQQQTRDPVTKALDPNGGHSTAGWVGFANYTENFTISTTKSDGSSWAILQGDAVSGETILASQASGIALKIGDGTISANVGHKFVGDGSGLTKLAQGINTDYTGAINGMTTVRNVLLGAGTGRDLINEGFDIGATRNEVITALGANAMANASNAYDMVAIGNGSQVDSVRSWNTVSVGNNTFRKIKPTGRPTEIALITTDITIDVIDPADRFAGRTSTSFVAGGTGYADGTYDTLVTGTHSNTGNYGIGGAGLKVDVVTDGNGVVTSATINSSGTFYKTNEVVIIDGGDKNCLIEIVAHDDNESTVGGIAVGHNAGLGKEGGPNDILIGNLAGQYLYNAKNNVYVGSVAGRYADKSERNVAIGYASAHNAMDSVANVAVGEYSFQGNGTENVMLGASAGRYLTTGDRNIIIGAWAGANGDYSGRIYLGSDKQDRVIIPAIKFDSEDYNSLPSASLMAWNKVSNGFEPMPLTTDGIEISDPDNLVTRLTDSILAGGPTTTVQHDVLAFGGHPLVKAAMFSEVQRIDDDTWESLPVNFNLFAQKKNQFIQVIEMDTALSGAALEHKSYRLTIDSAGQMGYCNAKNLQIGTSHVNESCFADVLVEYATNAELTTWVTAHESFNVNMTASFRQFKCVNFGAYYGMRITITTVPRITGGGVYGTIDPAYEGTFPYLPLNSIKFMTSRPGNQGRGPEYQVPYDWNGDKEIIAQGQFRLKASDDVTRPDLSFDRDQNTGISNQAGTSGIDFIVDGVVASNLNPSGGRFSGRLQVGDRLTVDEDIVAGGFYYDQGLNRLQMLNTDADRVSDYGSIKAVIIDDGPEDNGTIWPSISNDLAYRAERGAANITISPELAAYWGSDAEIHSQNLFNASGGYRPAGTQIALDVDGNPIQHSVELMWAGIDNPLSYGTKVGIVFHNNSFAPDYVKLETYDNATAAWKIVCEYTDFRSFGINTIALPADSNTSQGMSGIRFTFASNTARDMRIRKIFASNYASNGPETMYVSRSGGDIYGDTKVKGAFKQEWTYVNTDATVLEINRKYLVDSGVGALSIVLPASANFGDEIAIVDMGGAASIANITVSRNGHNIMGTADNLVLDTDRAGITLIYTSAAHGWVLKDN